MTDNALEGDLSEASFARIVSLLARRRATGVVHIEDAVGTNSAYFLDGAPRGANLARLRHPLGQVLVDEGYVSREVMDEALDLHIKTNKLLGQVLLEMRVVSDDDLHAAIAQQSRRNLLSLFGMRAGQFSFHEGLVHLTDFTPSPMSPLAAIYEGVRDYAEPDHTAPLLLSVGLGSIRRRAEVELSLDGLGPAEKLAIELLNEHRFAAEIARAVPLPTRAVASLLFALHELAALKVSTALHVGRGAGHATA